MATKKKTGTSVDRAIKAARAKIAAANKKVREEKALKKKQATLKKLQNKVKAIAGTRRTKRRR